MALIDRDAPSDIMNKEMKYMMYLLYLFNPMVRYWLSLKINIFRLIPEIIWQYYKINKKFYLIETIYYTNMSVTKKFAAIILDHENIHEFNKILVEYGDATRQSSSHILFNIKPINMNQIDQDLSFFRITAETENDIKNKLSEIMDKLNEMNADYGIRDEETGEIFSTINAGCALDIKFDKIKIIPEGTYKKIDELKNTKTEFGYCVGYKPPFRPIESKEIDNIEIKDETIYFFSRTKESHAKLKDCLTEKIMEINPDFILEFRTFL